MPEIEDIELALLEACFKCSGKKGYLGQHTWYTCNWCNGSGHQRDVKYCTVPECGMILPVDYWLNKHGLCRACLSTLKE